MWGKKKGQCHNVSQFLVSHFPCLLFSPAIFYHLKSCHHLTSPVQPHFPISPSLYIPAHFHSFLTRSSIVLPPWHSSRFHPVFRLPAWSFVSHLHCLPGFWLSPWIRPQINLNVLFYRPGLRVVLLGPSLFLQSHCLVKETTTCIMHVSRGKAHKVSPKITSVNLLQKELTRPSG